MRFGKYTLWVGYEQDRRSGSRGGPDALPEDTSGHTVVLSRAEIGNILDKGKPAPSKVVPMAMPAMPAPTAAPASPTPTAGSTWPSLLTGFLLGTLFGAGALWLILNR